MSSLLYINESDLQGYICFSFLQVQIECLSRVERAIGQSEILLGCHWSRTTVKKSTL